MQFCQRHWDALRAAIDDNGLSGFVATGSKAVEKTIEDLTGAAITDPTIPFDPLMSAYWNLVMKLSENAPPESRLWVLVGDHCPMCTLDDKANGCTCGVPSHAQEWIESVSAFMRSEFIKHGWLKESSVQ